MNANLRHLRVFLAVLETGSMTRAADLCRVSQPAVTQAMAKLEAEAGQPLVLRRPGSIFATPAGSILKLRVTRTFDLLDPALAEVAPRLALTATAPQLKALIALSKAENFTLAAFRLGLSQPTVHRAISTLEQEVGQPLFDRTPHGVRPLRRTLALARAAQLAFSELEQARADLGELEGREIGSIVIGAMPLSRAGLLPRAIARFRQRWSRLTLRILDGPYTGMMEGLRRGEIDFLVGALRDPLPVADVVQEKLFDDRLGMLVRRGHPLAARASVTLAEVLACPMVAGAEGLPSRRALEQLIAPVGRPASLVESGSLALLRDLLRHSDHVGCISQTQAMAELEDGTLQLLPVDMSATARAIGITTRHGWLPTRAQRDILEDLRAVTATMA
ncbi:MAG: LysR family transcriptional regulator [Rubellimicrobium sp.]|nr:LysR family transcriptional regulator [Rubellimicrobium sp.]